jgi:hypothetical protein
VISSENPESLSQFTPAGVPFHHKDYISAGNDILVEYAGRSGIEPGGRDLKPRPPREQLFRLDDFRTRVLPA